MARKSQPSINEIALEKAGRYILATSLAWRNQLAIAIAKKQISRELALQLTQGALDDTTALMLNEAIGPLDMTLDGSTAKGMGGVLADHVMDIANKEEQLNAGL